MTDLLGECFGDLESADSFAGLEDADSFDGYGRTYQLGAGPDVGGIVSSIASAIPGVVSAAQGKTQAPEAPKPRDTESGRIFGLTYPQAAIGAAALGALGYVVLRKRGRR